MKISTKITVSFFITGFILAGVTVFFTEIEAWFPAVLVSCPVIAGLIGFFLSKNVSGPINKLHKGVEIIGSGDLDHKVGTEAEDEIGQLSRAFDGITSTLKKTTTSVDMLNREIGARKKTEEKLYKSKEQMQSLLDASQDMILQINMGMKIIWANKKALGMNPDAVGQFCHKVYMDSEEPCQGCPCKRAIETGQIEMSVIYQPYMKGAKGACYWWEDVGVPIKDKEGKIVGVIEIARDVTENKKAELQLRESEEKFRGITERSFNMIFTTDHEGLFTYVSLASEKIFQYKSKEMIGKCFNDYLVESDKPGVSRRFAENMEGKDIGITDLEVMRKDGTHAFIEFSSAPIFKHGDIIVGMQGVVRDVTERKKVEGELRKTADDLTERVRELNSLYGLSSLLEQPDISLEMVFQAIPTLIVPAWRYSESTCVRIIFEGKEYKTDNFKETKWKQTADIMMEGEKSGVLEVYYVDEKLEADEGPFLKEERILINVIAERLGRTAYYKKMQASLMQAERMAAVGTMAASVAHELRNPLGVIRLAIEGLDYHIKKKDDKIKRAVFNINKKVGEADKIISDLLNYSRLGKPVLDNTDVNELIEESLSDIDIEFQDKDIKVVKKFGKIPKIKIDQVQIREVFLNIIKNAYEAMEESGEFILSTETSGKNIKISFADSGCGISPEDMRKLYKPFFSTKAKGVGLGLALSGRIIRENHRGDITVNSEPGKGSVFIVELPV